MALRGYTWNLIRGPTGLNPRTNISNIPVNEHRYPIKSTSTHNYANDNSLSAATDSTRKLMKILENGADETLSWINDNFMSANLDKVQAIISTKNKRHVKDLKIEWETRVSKLQIK